MDQVELSRLAGLFVFAVVFCLEGGGRGGGQGVGFGVRV